MTSELTEALRRVRGSLRYHVQEQLVGYGEAARALTELDKIEEALHSIEPEPKPTRETLIRLLELALEKRPS